MPEKTKTMADVARHAGVHPATVSRALRDDPRITPEQRARVQASARTLGYRPNPLVAALMSTRRTGRPTTFRATIAYVTKYSRDRAAWFARAFGDILPGARDRARLQGYQIEEINLSDPALTPARTTEILAARGILGAIIAPLHAIGDAPPVDWTQLSAVAIGLSLSDVPITRATHHHFQGMSLALRHCRERGFRQPGLVVQRRVHEKVGKRWVAAQLLDETERAGTVHVPPLVLPDLDEKLFLHWFRKYDPDVILSHDFEPINTWLKRAGRPVPREVAFVNLDRRARDGDVAGIDQDYAGVGAAAVDLLIALLHRNNRGLPHQPATVLLEGTWVPGATLPLRT
jgi:LacI family transcriptional regulator